MKLVISLKLSPQQNNTWHNIQRAVVEAALKENGGQLTYAANALGMSINTFRNKAKAFGLWPWKGSKP